MSSNKNINVLFYSKYTATCLDLLKLMESHNILNKFVLKCIDDMDENQMPKALKVVPTLLVSGIEKPLEGKEALIWFNDNRQFFLQQNAEQHSRQIVNNMSKNMMNGPKGMSGELEGTSDMYAYCDVDEAQPKSFCKSVEDGDVIVTPPQDKKIVQGAQSTMIKQVDSIRKEQEKEYNDMMKQDHIDRLMQLERDKLIKTGRMGL